MGTRSDWRALVFTVIFALFANTQSRKFACSIKDDHAIHLLYTGKIEEGDTFMLDTRAIKGVVGSYLVFEDVDNCESFHLRVGADPGGTFIRDGISSMPCNVRDWQERPYGYRAEYDTEKVYYEVRCLKDRHLIFLNGKFNGTYSNKDLKSGTFRDYTFVRKVCLYSYHDKVYFFDPDHKIFNPDLRIPKKGMITFPEEFDMYDLLSVRGVYCTRKEPELSDVLGYKENYPGLLRSTIFTLKNFVKLNLLVITINWILKDFELSQWGGEVVYCDKFRYSECREILDVLVEVTEEAYVVRLNGVKCQILHVLDPNEGKYLDPKGANFDPFHVRLRKKKKLN